MEIKVLGRHLNIFGPVKEYVTEKVSRLERFYDHIQRVDVTLSTEGEEKVVEMHVHARHGGPFIASESQGDFYAAIDLLVDKMSRQLKKQKEKLKDRQYKSGRKDTISVEGPGEDDGLETYQQVIEKTDFQTL